jgi:hypothetical protein
MADASDISALLKVAKAAEAKKVRRAREDAALEVEKEEGIKRLKSNRMAQREQLENKLEDSQKQADEELQTKAKELIAKQDAEMVSLKQRHIEEKIRLGEETRVALIYVKASKDTLRSELEKELDEKETLLESTMKDKMQRLHAARLAEDRSERATVEQHSTILNQLSVLFQQTQTTPARSGVHSEFSTSPRAQDIPANNVDGQLHKGQLHEEKVDDNVHSEGTPRPVPVSPASDDDRLARLNMLIERNKRENEEVFGLSSTVTPLHGEKRPHVSEQPGATSNTPSSPVTPASSASTLDGIVVEGLQTPKRRRLESATNGGAVAATSPSPSTPTSTSKFMDAPHEKTPGSASRFTFTPFRDALPTPSPTPSTPASPSLAFDGFNSKGYLGLKINKYKPGSRHSQKASKSPAKSSSSTSAPPIPNKIHSVRHFRSTKPDRSINPDDTCQWSFWTPTPKHPNFSIKWWGHKFEPVPVKGANGKPLEMPKEFTIEPGRVWKFEYSLTEALVHMKRKASDGQYAWIRFKDKETLKAFINEYKSHWPDKLLTEKYELEPRTHSYITD